MGMPFVQLGDGDIINVTQIRALTVTKKYIGTTIEGQPYGATIFWVGVTSKAQLGACWNLNQQDYLAVKDAIERFGIL